MTLASPFFFFFFNNTAPTELYTLSLHDALPIADLSVNPSLSLRYALESTRINPSRSEEHTSELQSRVDLVCRLRLEKKKERSTYQWRLLAKAPWAIGSSLGVRA